MRGSITKRGDSWTAVVDLPPDPTTGKRRQKRVTARTKREVERQVAELIQKANTGFVGADGTAGHAGTRFDLQVSQSLPFMQFSGTEWEMLVGLRSLFREDLLESSIYDELLVLRSPKQFLGGVTVRF